MNTKQIDYVLEIAKTKNFNRAAENLFISQPALSYQIKLVENEIVKDLLCDFIYIPDARFPVEISQILFVVVDGARA